LPSVVLTTEHEIYITTAFCPALSFTDKDGANILDGTTAAGSGGRANQKMPGM
jgi:hypothetical protein